MRQRAYRNLKHLDHINFPSSDENGHIFNSWRMAWLRHCPYRVNTENERAPAVNGGSGGADYRLNTRYLQTSRSWIAQQ